MIIAIDPANVESAFCIIDCETYKPIEFGKMKNEELALRFNSKDENSFPKYDKMIIEMVACYGMSVGKEIFNTCVWIGRFIELCKCDYEFIYRKDEKINLCNSMRAKDSNIRQALIDRFGVVGVKNNKGFFYGFKADIWSAYAVGITYLDMQKR